MANDADRDERVDVYIASAADFARPVLQHLRALVHRTLLEVKETIKWGMPHFTLAGKNVAGMAAFKAHCAFSIHGENRGGEGMGSLGRITALGDLPPDTELTGRLLAARDRICNSGSAVKRTASKAPKPEIAMPDDFGRELSANESTLSYWETFPPSARREYLEWITEAKTDSTRAKRLSQALEWIAQGKRRNWKYERR